MSDPLTGLTARFLYDWPVAPTSAGLGGIPQDRKDELLAAGRYQADIQRASTVAIVGSNIVAADIIANEIAQQTEILEAALENAADQISQSVLDAAEEIVTAVEILGDRLCVSLDEINWQLSQISQTLEGILLTLRENRSNEARQLVEQGIRHYVNGQYDRAEERFRNALTQDTTDYQVLMNLGLIAVQKGESEEAAHFFNDALRLPANLDGISRKRALLALARLAYAERNYREAAAVARKAMGLGEVQSAQELFTLSMYEGLAAEKQACLENLEKSIRDEPMLFSKAAVDPNFDAIRDEVVALLGRLAADALMRVHQSTDRIRKLLSQTTLRSEGTACNPQFKRANYFLERTTRTLENPSYTDLLRLEAEAAAAAGAVKLLLVAQRSESNVRKLELASAAANEELTSLREVKPLRVRFWFLWHLGTWIAFIVVLDTLAVPKYKADILLEGWLFLGTVVWFLLTMFFEERADLFEERFRQQASLKASTLATARSQLVAARKVLDSQLQQCSQQLEAAGC